MKDSIQSDSIRQETERVQGMIRRNIENVALIPGASRGEDRGERDGRSEVRAFYFMNAGSGKPAMREPAVDSLGNGNGARKPAPRVFQAVDLVAELIENPVGRHS